MTLLKIEDAMFSFINTPEGITNLPIANTHFCRIFGSVDLRAFSPRPAPDRPADFHSRPAPPRPAPRIFILAPPRPAPLEKAPPRTSLVGSVQSAFGPDTGQLTEIQTAIDCR